MNLEITNYEEAFTILAALISYRSREPSKESSTKDVCIRLEKRIQNMVISYRNLSRENSQENIVNESGSELMQSHEN